jgi:hypothetical protein
MELPATSLLAPDLFTANLFPQLIQVASSDLGILSQSLGLINLEDGFQVCRGCASLDPFMSKRLLSAQESAMVLGLSTVLFTHGTFQKANIHDCSALPNVIPLIAISLDFLVAGETAQGVYTNVLRCLAVILVGDPPDCHSITCLTRLCSNWPST